MTCVVQVIKKAPEGGGRDRDAGAPWRVVGAVRVAAGSTGIETRHVGTAACGTRRAADAARCNQHHREQKQRLQQSSLATSMRTLAATLQGR